MDLLLGADVFPYIIRNGRPENLLIEPVGIETVFGLALMDKSGNANPQKTTLVTASLGSVDKALRRFWEIEELPNILKTSPTEQQCGEIYCTSTTSQADSRYVVHLPFNSRPPQLGQSRLESPRISIEQVAGTSPTIQCCHARLPG